jgi:hypothetical protein
VFTTVLALAFVLSADPPGQLNPQTLEVGQVGELMVKKDGILSEHAFDYKVSSVRDDSLIVQAKRSFPGRTDDGPRYLVIRGVPTKDRADDQAFKPTGQWKVTGTEKVKLAGGGTKTLLVLEPAKDEPKKD